MKNTLIILISMLAMGSLQAMEPQTPKRKAPQLRLEEFPSPEKTEKSPKKRLLTRSNPEQPSFAQKRLQYDEESEKLKKLPENHNEAQEKAQSLLKEAKSLFIEASFNDENIKFVREMLEQGMDPNFQSPLGSTPLHNALQTSDNFQMVKLLLQHGAKVTTPNTMKDTPLHTAVSSFAWDEKTFTRKEKILSMLLSKEIIIDSVDCKNNFGNTPLLRLLDPRQQMPTAYRMTLAKKLLERGANPLEKNVFGQDALELAQKCGCSQELEQAIQESKK